MFHLLRLWFGVRLPVPPAAYAASGLTLALLKYAVEGAAIWHFTGKTFWPWDFLNPLFTMRMDLLQGAPEWLGWAMFVWSLPFLWIAATMSVRRAADAAISPWIGLLVVVPILNLLVMLGLCLAPKGPGEGWTPTSDPLQTDQQIAGRAAMSIALSMLCGAAMMLVSVYLFESYGAALFVGTPLLMGVVAGYLFNRTLSHGFAKSMGLGLAAVVVACGALLLFAFEGVICILMAAPLVLPLGLLGGLMGKAIADATRRPAAELLALVMVLPAWAAIESQLLPREELVVCTSIEIDAPPEVVWRHVVAFPDLAPPEEWHFRLGIAYPERARIEGEGVGAVRYCEFSTGAFVEPITDWSPPRRLAFDVVEQPAPMFELTPYRHIHPPHLDFGMRSNRGEFLLEPLPGGRTRLTGSTWYEIDMLPRSYWSLWSNAIVHSIHGRVLEHVRSRCAANDQ
jgi:uncharacterized membrane protein YhaH (DUF805 family)